MDVHRTGESYWVETTEATAYPPLDGHLSVDVAMIGGGVAGLCTAWELVSAGRSVAVLEADRIASGVTGHTTAKLSALQTFTYDRLRRSAGADTARWYARTQQDAIDRVELTAESLGVDCDFERAAAYTYVESPDGVDQARAEADAARDAGLSASLVTDTPLPYDVAGAVKVENQAQFHPRRYLLAVAEGIVERRGVIHERTRVVDLDEGEPCELTTDTGATVTARDVVVATHYPIFDRALLFARLVPHREVVVAGPLPEDRAPDGMYITPEHGKRSVRTAPYRPGQRLLIVTGESFTPGEADVTERYERLESWTRERFALKEITHRWAAQDNQPTDGLPYIGLLHAAAKHAYVATGFGGWGLTNGVVSGLLLAALITDQVAQPPWADIYDPRRLHPLREAGAAVTAQAKVARHLVGDRLRPTHVDSVEDVDPGSGAIVRLRGERCAVYRDGAGAAHAVSATCTHLGCVVAFNDAETSWDCPCHGSRFGVDGAVLNGPATRPLEGRDT
ncbi:MAG: FAD-dependent oxidoreductase [Streptosporangiales bacterium]|nr:FAD-dependent oxidoreductase [Streptosporangiales bacterium]